LAPTPLKEVLYTASCTSVGGRDGNSKSNDGKLAVTLTHFAAKGPGTNPEQLFASGYSACFLGALKFVAGAQKQALPADVAVTAEVDLGTLPTKGFCIGVRLRVKLPGMDKATAEKLLEETHLVCPYSNATRGNIKVETFLE